MAARKTKDALARIRQGGRRIAQYEEDLSDEDDVIKGDDDIRDFIVNDDGGAYEDELFSEDDQGLSSAADTSARLLREIARKETQRAGGQQGIDRFLKKTGDLSGGPRKTQNAAVSKNLDNILDNFDQLMDEEDSSARVVLPSRRPVHQAAPRTVDADVAKDAWCVSPPVKRVRLELDVATEAPLPVKVESVLKEEEEEEVIETAPMTGGWDEMELEKNETEEEIEKEEEREGQEEKVKEGDVMFYYLDAYEDVSTATVLLFGKTQDFESCCVAVKSLHRTAYLLLRDMEREEDETVVKQKAFLAFTEFEEMRKAGKFGKLVKFKVKLVRRKFYFDVDASEGGRLPQGDLWVLKIKYSAESFGCNIPEKLVGEHFQHVFGVNKSLVETVLVKQKIMGPCWLRLSNNPSRITSAHIYSHCASEYVVHDLHDIHVVEDFGEVPPLRILSLSMKTQMLPTRGGGVNHLLTLVSGYFLKAATLTVAAEDSLRPDARRGDLCFTAVRVPDGCSLSRRDVEEVNRLLGPGGSVELFASEKTLLSWILSKVKLLDPDVVCGHKLCDVDLDLLISRAHLLKVGNVQFLGRRRVTGNATNAHGWGARGHCTGRLLLDVHMNAKELLAKEVNYELDTLVGKVLLSKRTHFVQEMLLECFSSPKSVAHLVNHTMSDCVFSLRVGWRLQVLPLTKQLSNIAGNLWAHSLLNRRAERNEWLLLHEFARHKFILPDKRKVSSSAFSSEEPGAAGKKTGKTGQYLGGLVLEPKTGLYDELTLLLDFNSLYPSIIREYNICFTTVQRVSTETEEAGGLPELPGTAAGTGDSAAVLPAVITRLVETRKRIKQVLAKEKNEDKRRMLDIKQKAVKLIANSMYGCLGFSSSRFYAKQLAALITATGRRNLEATVRLVEEELRLSVVYGDTDSIFVASKTRNFQEAMSLGRQIVTQVNKKYQKLEIEIDGVFKNLLLLKKKKYAGVAVVDWDKQIFSLETKGLDLVRRDWCILSKNMGQVILDVLLQRSDSLDKEQVASAILDYLKAVNVRIETGQVALDEWSITKSLTKQVHEYPDAKNQPHVLVAKRLIDQGHIIKPGAEIPYVISREDQAADVTESVAARARSVEEAKRDNLAVDIAWYKQQQIFPPISRLLVAPGILEAARIAEALGLDPAKFQEFDDEFRDVRPGEAEGEDAEIMASEDPEVKYASLKLRFRDRVACPKCGVALNLVQAIKTSCCNNCAVKLPEPFVGNLLVLSFKDLLSQAGQGMMVCNDDQCRKTTRQVWSQGSGTRCAQTECTGRLDAEIPTMSLYHHFTFAAELLTKFKKQSLADFVTRHYVDRNTFDVVNVTSRFAVFGLAPKPRDVVRGG